MPNYRVSPEQIDALLPQTQCRECGYAGCLPYAKAITNQGEALDRCIPGGTEVLKKLGELLQQDVTALLAQLEQKQSPPTLVRIREQDCIGCTKCIKACPVDAIIGTVKQMHTVLKDECTGCQLCIAPCPVDCIDIVVIEKPDYSPDKARERYFARNKRLIKEKTQETLTYKREKSLPEINSDNPNSKKAAIQAAVARAKAKKVLNNE